MDFSCLYHLAVFSAEKERPVNAKQWRWQLFCFLPSYFAAQGPVESFFLAPRSRALTIKWLGWRYKSFHVLISSRERRPCHRWVLSLKGAGLASSLSLDSRWSVTLRRKAEEREQLCLPYNFLGSSGDWGVILVLVLPSGPVFISVLRCRLQRWNCSQGYLIVAKAKLAYVFISAFISP